MCTSSANRIKAVYIDHIVSTMGPDVVIGNEVMYGASGKVADLILLYNGNTYAIEIKSDTDSLARIEGQLFEYRKQFNYVIVVCGPKYADILARSLPNGIGLCKILEDETVKDLRRPKKNTKLDKTEMLFSVKTSYLIKVADFPTAGKNADEIRAFFERKRISYVQKILYEYWLIKMKPIFELFISDRNDLNHHEETLNSYASQSQTVS